ncbi:hypothetical protein KI387_025429, partial [Taxus chinensis]
RVDVAILVVIGGNNCEMERMMFWNGVWVTDTMGGCDAIGIYEVVGADGDILKVDDEGMVDTMGENDVKSVTDAIGATDIDDVGSSWDTMGGKVEE